MMVPFRVLSIIRHLVFRGPKTGPIILTYFDNNPYDLRTLRLCIARCSLRGGTASELPCKCFQNLGTLFKSPYTKDHSILGPALGPPVVGNSHVISRLNPMHEFVGMSLLCKPLIQACQ